MYLAAALGTWTELKHDTILYSKQAYSMAQCAMAGLAKGITCSTRTKNSETTINHCQY